MFCFSAAAVRSQSIYSSTASLRRLCSAAAGEGAKKGYWVTQVVDIKDKAKYSDYEEASMSTFAPGNKYGAKTLISEPIAKVLKGNENIQLAALVEFDSVQAAIDVWDDPEYVAARSLLGDTNDESSVVERRVCVIEADPIEEIHPGDGFWLNHVEEILDEEKFDRYAESSMPVFDSAHFGQVVHQHVGSKKIKMAAALRFNSIERALDTYNDSPEYISARFAGTMEDVEDHVVARTICAVEVPETKLRRSRAKSRGNGRQ